MRQRLILIALIVLTLAGISKSPAQNLEYVGSTLWTGINDIKVIDGIAYCAFTNGLMILDVGDPTAVFEYGKAFCPGEGERVVVSGRYAYLADGPAGLQIIDIYRKDNPVVVGSYNTPGTAVDVAVSGNYAYIADDTAGLQIIDITELSNPVRVGSWDLPEEYWWAGEIAVVGSYAYIGTHLRDGYIFVIDINDPVHPLSVGSLFISAPGSSSHGIVGIIPDGDLLYVGGSGSHHSLYVVDISNPPNLYVLGSSRSYDTVVDITLEGNKVLSLGGGEVTTFTIGDPERPKMTGRYNFSRDIYPEKGIHFADNKIYIAGGRAMEIIDAANPDSLYFLGLYMASGLENSSADIAVSGSYAFVPMSSALHIVDVSNPYQPARIGSCVLPNRPRNVAAAGNFAYATIQLYGLYIIDATDPHHSFIAGTYLPQSITANISALQGNYAYLSTGLGLEIVDISNPASPTLAGQYWRLGKVAVSGVYAYMAVWPNYEFQVINVADPALPTLVASLPMESGARDVVVQGSYAYLTANPGFRIIDVSDPSAPAFAGSCSLDVFPINLTPIAYDFRLAGNYAYLAILDGGRVCGGAMVVDVSDPYNPSAVSYFYQPGYSYNIDYQNGYCYLIGEYSMAIFSGISTGIAESPVTPSEFSLSQNYPNPFNARTILSYNLSKQSRVSIQIYNLLGQRVATLLDGVKPPGSHQAIWDSAGVPSGVYFARLESDSKAQTVKMVVLK